MLLKERDEHPNKEEPRKTQERKVMVVNNHKRQPTHLDSEEDPQRQPLPHAQEGPQPQVLSVLAISRSLSLTHKREENTYADRLEPPKT